MDVQDYSILLLGTGGGIGAALALELAARSARLTLEGRRRGPLDEVAAAVRERGGQPHMVGQEAVAGLSCLCPPLSAKTLAAGYPAVAGPRP